MENKNGIMIFNILFIMIGVFVGWLICINGHSVNTVPNMMHQMPDGSMMRSDGMTMENMMSGMMEGLKGKTADAFDKEFLSEMIVHHQGAVEMAQMVLKTSKRPELIKLANDIIIAQTKEIGMMQEWQKTWFK